MEKYINPYDIAKTIEFDNLNKENFKKFKKRVLNQLELFDDEIEIYNQKFSKNEIYEMLDAIDNDRNLLDIYFLLYNEEKNINNFLYGVRNQNIKEVFSDIKFLDERVKIFVEPFIVERLSKIYKEAFVNKNIDILKITPPVSKIYLEQIYEPIYKMLKNIQNELLSKENQNIDFYEIQKIIGDVDFINQLPDYFDKVRNDIALIVRNLSVDVWNKNENIDLAIKLINLALKFKLNSKNKNNFLNDKKQLEELKENIKKSKYLEQIENILYSRENFYEKIKKIHNVVQSNNEFDDELLKYIFFMILNYIEDNKINLLEKNNLKSLKNLFIFFKTRTKDYEFLNILNSNINDIIKISRKIDENTITNFIWLIVGLIIIFVVLTN